MNDSFEANLLLIISLVAVVIAVACTIAQPEFTDDIHIIVVKDKYESYDGYYIVDINDGIYSVSNKTIYDRMYIGRIYTIDTRGIRLPPLSLYPNIMSSQQTISLESNSCYLRDIPNVSNI